MTIKGREEALCALKSEFASYPRNDSIRHALMSAIDDAMTWGEAEVDLSEIGARDIQRLAEAARELTGHDVEVTA